MNSTRVKEFPQGSENGSWPRRIAVLALVLILNSLSLRPSFASDWPLFRGDQARTGYASEQLYPPLSAEDGWEFQAGGSVVSSPVVYKGVLYFGARDNKIYALNARTGALRWRFETGGWVDATPAVSGGAVYVPSMDGYLYALDRATGDILWRAGLGAASVSSPLVLDGKVFLGSGSPENKLKVFNTATGNLLFEYNVDQPVDSAPATDGTRVYFGANDGGIYAINKTGFAQIWSYQTAGGRYGMNAIAVSSGSVYALPGMDEKRPLVLNALTGTWLNGDTPAFDKSVSSGSWEQISSPLVANDTMYFVGGSSRNYMYAMDRQDYGYVWTSTPSFGLVSDLGLVSSPVMANEIMYISSAPGNIVSFSSDEDPVPLVANMSFSDPIYASPCISNGMLYVATFGGKIKAYRSAKITSISSPGADEIISGNVAVSGYVVNSDLTGYELEYSSTSAPYNWHSIRSSATTASVENGELAVWDTANFDNGLYELRLTASENPVSGTDNTAFVRVRINSAPQPPADLSAADVPGDKGNQIRLTWPASVSEGVTEYRVFRDGGEGFSKIMTVSSDSLTCVDETAVTGSTFSYVVRSFDGYVESANSASRSAYSVNNTGDNIAPSKVNDLTAIAGPAGGTATLFWTAPGNDGSLGTASHYVVKYTTVPGYDWNGFDGTALTGVTIPVEGPAGDNMSADIGGLFGGVTYYFAVKTVDFADNLSAVSNAATAYATLDLIPPQPPSELTVSDTPGDDGGRLTLAWTLSPDDGAGAGDVYGYKIYRRLQNSVYVSSAPYAIVSKGVSAAVDPGATTNVRFYYSVAAFDSTNNSQFSNESHGVAADNWRFFSAAQGVSIRLADGSRVDLPEGAASQNGDIMISRLDAVTLQPLAAMKTNTLARPTSIAYEIKFKDPNTKLVKPALITLAYTDDAVTGMDQSNLRMYTLSGDTWLAISNSKSYPELKTVTAEVNHFSRFRIMEYIPSGALLSEDSVYTYPNPAKGDSLTFKFYLADKAYVTVDVYNVAGEKVARFEKPNCPAGSVSEIVWDIKNIASGVYQYKVEAKSASGSKFLIKRLAVIH